MNGLDYKVEVFTNLDCATGTPETFDFNKVNMNFNVPAKKFAPG